MGVFKKIVVAGLAIAGLAGVAAPAGAQSAGYELDAVSATQFLPGTDGEIHGNGICGDVKLTLIPAAGGPEVDLGTITADDSGVFDGKFTIPEGTAVGDYIIKATGVQCAAPGASYVLQSAGVPKSLRYSIKVVTEIVGDNGPSLALAGSESSKLLAIATGLIIAGGVAVGGVQLRRRRQTLTLA